MDQQTLDKIIPISGLDRAIGNVTGGINTGQYYKEIYGTHQYGVPTDTLRIETVPARNTQTSQTTQPSQTTVVIPQKNNPETPASATRASEESRVYESVVSVNSQPQVPVDAGGVFYSLINALFSVAVVLSVMGLMGVAYIIIRTRQLHHHEHDVRHAGEGHGHAAPTTQSHGSTAAPAHHPPSTSHEPLQIDPHPIEVKPHEQDAEDDEYEFVDAPSTDSETIPDDVLDVPEKEAQTTKLGARWDTIQLKAHGDDENDWRFALMDAELLLEDALTARGIPGTTLEDKFASKEMEDFATHMIARDAYALHNRIRAGEIPLSADSIQELISLYAKVFRELNV